MPTVQEVDSQVDTRHTLQGGLQKIYDCLHHIGNYFYPKLYIFTAFKVRLFVVFQPIVDLDVQNGT